MHLTITEEALRQRYSMEHFPSALYLLTREFPGTEAVVQVHQDMTFDVPDSQVESFGKAFDLPVPAGEYHVQLICKRAREYVLRIVEGPFAGREIPFGRNPTVDLLEKFAPPDFEIPEEEVLKEGKLNLGGNEGRSPDAN